MKYDLLIISGPSGVGKDAVLDELLKIKKLKLEEFLSVMTRKPRPGEKNGVDNYYVSEAEFKRMIKAGKFYEYQKYGGHWYGKPKSEMARIKKMKRMPVVNMDVRGARAFKKEFGKRALAIFLLPPSFEVLEERIRRDKGRTDIRQRLERAKEEIHIARQDIYDYMIVNEEGQLKQTAAKIARLLTNK